MLLIITSTATVVKTSEPVVGSELCAFLGDMEISIPNSERAVTIPSGSGREGSPGKEPYVNGVSTRKMERLVKNLRERFHLSQVVPAGDRGPLTSARIEELKGIEGMDWTVLCVHRISGSWRRRV